MARISDIKQQVKRQTRYSIYIDKKYAFSLSEAELLASGLRIGQDYTSEGIEELRQRAVLDKAYMRCLDYLARRARSQWELRDYLKRKDYDSPTTEAILNKLSDMGYVDDLVFARAWIDNRRLLKPTPRRRLRQELRQKRVDDAVITQALEEDETDERTTLKEVIAKKRSQSRYQDDQKLLAYLIRQGYRYDDVKAVMSGQED